MKGIVALVATASALILPACSFFAPGEAVQHESGRTRYRAAEENPADAPDVVALREKVPGDLADLPRPIARPDLGAIIVR